jgi:hypothetical protein
MYPICFADLDFDRTPVKRSLPSGAKLTSWAATGMPRIPSTIINSVFFLYKTFEDADAGINPHGTGFIVAEPGRQKGFYAVTNWHVACDGGACVIRAATRLGKPKIFDLNPDQWEFIPNGPDIAIAYVELDDDDDLQTYISPNLFIRKPNPATPYWNEADIGDDAFMIGMFFDHQAKSKNIPAARFGNVSMLPDVSGFKSHGTNWLT